MKKINYDDKHDVLYIILNDMHNTYGDEDDNGIVYMKDGDTDEVKGFIIYYLKNKINDTEFQNILLEYEINFDIDILPYANNIK